MGLSISRALGVLDSRLLRDERILEVGAGEWAIAEALGLVAGAGEAGPPTRCLSKSGLRPRSTRTIRNCGS
jgi:hypothetical protein